MLDFTSAQAFIEMNTEEASNTMVNYYTTVTPVLRSQAIYIQFSNHKELKTDNSPNQAVSFCSLHCPTGGRDRAFSATAVICAVGAGLGWGLGFTLATKVPSGACCTFCEFGSI